MLWEALLLLVGDLEKFRNLALPDLALAIALGVKDLRTPLLEVLAYREESELGHFMAARVIQACHGDEPVFSQRRLASLLLFALVEHDKLRLGEVELDEEFTDLSIDDRVAETLEVTRLEVHFRRQVVQAFLVLQGARLVLPSDTTLYRLLEVRYRHFHPVKDAEELFAWLISFAIVCIFVFLFNFVFWVDVHLAFLCRQDQ